MVYKPVLDLKHPLDHQCAAQSLLSHILQKIHANDSMKGNHLLLPPEPQKTFLVLLFFQSLGSSFLL